jgi:hypothetical protein
VNAKELTGGEVQISILTLLYKQNKAHPNDPELTRQQIVEGLGIPENGIILNANYLEEKDLIYYEDTAEGVFIWAKITANGIDALDNKEKMKRTWNFLGVKIPIHIEAKFALFNL